jgi:putative ABC transport system permease protein
MVPIKYSIKNLTTRRSTTIAAAFGLALVVFVFATVLMLSNGIEKTLGRSAQGDIAILQRKGAENELSSFIEGPALNIVLAAAEVARRADGRPDGVGEVAIAAVFEKADGKGSANVQIRGVTSDVMVFRPNVKIVEGRPLQPNTDEVIIGRAIRGRYKGMELGATLELRKNHPMKVVGVFDDGGTSFESEIWTDVETLRAVSGRPGLISSIRVRLASASKFDSFKASLAQTPRLSLEVLRESDYYDRQSAGTSLFIRVMGLLITAFCSIGATIGAMITMHASVANRRREIGTLRALGFSRTSILLSCLLESLTLALIGGTLGVFGALAMSLVEFSFVNLATGTQIVFPFEPTPRLLLMSLTFTLGMGLLGGMVPAVRAAWTNPIVAMRD